MTYTLSDGVEATRRLLYGSSRPNRNQLATTVTATGTAVVCTYATTNVATHSMISIDQELMYVWSKDDTTKTLTVSRGELGTTGAAHTAPLKIEVNARFPGASIALAITDEIRSWEPDLYRVADTAFTSSNWPGLVDVGAENAEAYGIVTARYSRTTGHSVEWIDLAGSTLIRGLATADYPSGVGVTMNPPQGWQLNSVPSPTSFRIGLGLPFDLEFESITSDLVDDVGLARSMCDLAVWGAAIRLLASAEVSRTDPTAQGQARDVTQVRVGDQTQVAAALQRKFNERFAQEVAKLRSRYPIRYS